MFDVQFITHRTPTISYLDSVRIALAGGCRWVQLRMKEASEAEVEAVACEALSLCRAAGALFIVDDRVELAHRIGADGVHLGLGDMPVDEARRRLGPKFRIGGTANTFDDVRLQAARGADYIGCGPFRHTTTKQKLAPLLGPEGYRSILERMRVGGIALPVVAIGGVGADDIPLLRSLGMSGIALSGSVLRASDPVAEMRRVVELARQES